MSHPARFDPDDPLLARLRAVCLRFPGAGEKISHGRPNFFTRKIFTKYNAVEKGAHSSDRWARSVVILPDSGERYLSSILFEGMFDERGLPKQ